MLAYRYNRLFVIFKEPILSFLVIIEFSIRGFGIRGHLSERIYRE